MCLQHSFATNRKASPKFAFLFKPDFVFGSSGAVFRASAFVFRPWGPEHCGPKDLQLLSETEILLR